MAIILGLVTIVYSSAIESILRIMIGIWIIYSGFMRFTVAFRLKETIDTKLWAFVLVLAVAMIVGGMYVTFYPGALVVTLGVIILSICNCGFNREFYIHEKYERYAIKCQWPSDPINESTKQTKIEKHKNIVKRAHFQCVLLV